MTMPENDPVADLAKQRAAIIKSQRATEAAERAAEIARLGALRAADLAADKEKFGRLVDYLAYLSRTEERFVSVADIASDLGLTRGVVAHFCKEKLGLYTNHANSSLLGIPRRPTMIQKVRKGPFVTHWNAISADEIWDQFWLPKLDALRGLTGPLQAGFMEEVGQIYFMTRNSYPPYLPKLTDWRPGPAQQVEHMNEQICISVMAAHIFACEHNLTMSWELDSDDVPVITFSRP